VTQNSRKKTTNRRRRAARVALVASVAAALSLPLLTQSLHGQTGNTAAAAPAAPKAAAAAPTTSATKLDPNTVIASVGDVKVTAADFDTAISQQSVQQQAAIINSPEGKKSFADYLIKMKAVAKEAEKRGIDKEPKVQEQIAMARQNILVSNLLMTLGGDEAGNRKYFDQHPEQFGKVQARHILISPNGPSDPKAPKKPALTDEQAKKKAEDIRARWAKGEDFGALVKESDDSNSIPNGGVYTFGRGEMVPAFEQAAYALKENEISQPVKTQFGYHVIQLQKHLPGTFEDAKQQVPGMRVEAFIKDLVADVKFNDAFINAGPVNPDTTKPAAAAPGAAATAPPAAKK
jgi:peptidyl-prolyl cis-trans isomerase C